MITLFKSNETDFSHNGIGNLDYHIINPVVEEELNGLYSFTFRYPLFAPHGLKIEGESILRVPVPGMEDQLFRVYRHVKSMGYITVSCYHIFYDLADNFIEDTNIVEKNGQGAIQQLGGATQFNHNFRFFSDISTVANARLVRKNVVASILDDEQGNSFVSRWGGELIRNNFDIRMNQSAGSNKGFTVKYRKNLTGYEADVDDSTVITRIMPKGFDGLLLPEKYIDSPLIDNYERPKIKMIDYNDVKAAIGEYADDEDAIPLEDAYAELRRLANEEYSIHKVDIPTVRYQVNFVTLDQTEEYKDLQDLQQLKMGDMATIDHEEDNFKVTAKLVKYRWDPIAKRYLSAELGSIHDGITTQFTDINAINRKVDEVIERTNIIQATADGKSTIYRGESEPVNPNLRDLWYKPNGAETEMYQFVDEGGQRFWKLIADTADTTSVRNDVDQALADSQTAKNQANEAVGKAELATSNANEAIGQAQDAFDDAQLALTTAQGLTNRMSSVEGDISTLSQTTQSFATRIENAEGDISTLTQTAQGLQNRVADAEDNITSVTQLATGMQTRLTNAEGNINTLTTTASSLESTISGVRDDLDGLEIGGRNLLPDSEDMGRWYAYSGATVTKTEVDMTAEWGFSNAVRMKSSGGTNIIRLLYSTSLMLTEPLVLNTVYTYSIFVKNMGTKDILLHINGLGVSGTTTNITIRAGESKRFSATGKRRVNYDWFQPQFRPLNISDDIDVIVGREKLEKGNKATDWSPAPEDMATQSQITQLSDNINARVKKGDVIAQINLEANSGTAYIGGKAVILDGDTTVTGTFRVSNANITSVDAGKMTTGTLDAGQVNIINLNASNIVSGTIDTNLLTVRGGSAIDYTMIDGSYLESRGRFSRTWRGITETHDIKMRFENGYLRARNDSKNHSLYFTDFGISTYADGDGSGLSSGTLAFRELEYGNSEGVTLHSTFGAVALKSEENRVVIDSGFSASVESRGASIYLRPMQEIRPGANEFRLWVKETNDASLADGVLSYGSANVTDHASGLRFKKTTVGDPVVWVTDGNGIIGTGTLDADVVRANNFTTRGGAYSVYFNGRGGGTLSGSPESGNYLSAGGIKTNASDFFLGVPAGTNGKLRVTNGNGYNNGNGIGYRPIVASAFENGSSITYKTNIKSLSVSALNIINELSIVEYNLIDDVENGRLNNRQVGLISEHSLSVANSDGMAIDLYKLTSYNTKAIQELDTKLNLTREELILKIAQLEQRVNELESVA